QVRRAGGVARGRRRRGDVARRGFPPRPRVRDAPRGRYGSGYRQARPVLHRPAPPRVDYVSARQARRPVMWDVIAALIPPGVMAGVVIAFVVWLIRSQMAKKTDGEDELADTPESVRDDTKE